MSDENTYIIKKGDTFWDLEKAWNIPYGTLQKLNPDAKPRLLQIGQEIQIQMPTVVYLVAEEINMSSQMYCEEDFIGPRLPTPTDSLMCEADTLTPPSLPHADIHDENHNRILQNTVKGLTIGRKIGSLENLRRAKVFQSNELWHLQKNGVITHPWKKMANGRSHWNNNFVKMHKNNFQTAARARTIGGNILRKAGPTLLLADVGLSGEIKASHVVSGILIGAAMATGVGAILAGVYFIADIGLELTTGKGISRRLDGWVENSFGRLELYEGFY